MRFPPRPRRDLSQWHPWFAWHPVRVDGAWTWLETVERLVTECQGVRFYSYR